MQQHKLFAVPVYTAALDFEAQPVVEYLFKWREEDPEGHPRANRGASWHSDVRAFERAPLRPLADLILKHFVSVLKQEGAPEGTSTRMEEMWANISDPGGFHQIHQHGNTGWAGVLHLAGPADAPALHFVSPYHSMLHEEPFKPKHAAIFPGWLSHFVNPNPGPEARVSVSFNLVGVRR